MALTEKSIQYIKSLHENGINLKQSLAKKINTIEKAKEIGDDVTWKRETKKVQRILCDLFDNSNNVQDFMEKRKNYTTEWKGANGYDLLYKKKKEGEYAFFLDDSGFSCNLFEDKEDLSSFSCLSETGRTIQEQKEYNRNVVKPRLKQGVEYIREDKQADWLEWIECENLLNYRFFPILMKLCIFIKERNRDEADQLLKKNSKKPGSLISAIATYSQNGLDYLKHVLYLDSNRQELEDSIIKAIQKNTNNS